MTSEHPRPVASVVIPRSGGPPVIVLLVDDSQDDDLTSAIAEANVVPSDRFGGAWAADIAAKHDVARFLLIEYGGGMEREWRLPDWNEAVLRPVAADEHLVAILPHELAGDVRSGEFNLASVAGALIVEVEQASTAVAKLLAFREARRSA